MIILEFDRGKINNLFVGSYTHILTYIKYIYKTKLEISIRKKL